MTRSNGRRGNVRRAAVLLPVVGLLAAACGGDSDDSGDTSASGNGGDAAESCYEGDTATFTVPYSPGGGYDTIARGIAPFLEDELGATVVVENESGAGGLTAANNLYTADPEEPVFHIVNTQGILGAVLADAQGVQYDPGEYTWVARLTEDTRVLVTGRSTDLESIDDVMNADDTLQWATAGVGAADNIDANVVPTILGVADVVQPVSGFQGSSETQVAVASGDVDLGSGTLDSRVSAIEAGDERPLMVMSREPDENLPDTPALLELDLGDQQELAEAYIGLQEGGRAIVAPPGLPENCLAELQDAFETVLSNPEFQDTVGLETDFDYTSGEELRGIVEQVLDAPPELVELLKNAYAS